MKGIKRNTSHTQNTAQKRRLALKTLGGSALAGGLADKLPAIWQRPLVNAAVLPAHAQNSPLPNRVLLRVTGGASGGQATLSIPFELMREGDGSITQMVFRERQRVEVVHVSSPTLLNSLFPVAYAQISTTQAATTPAPGQPGATPMPPALSVLSLAQELVLNFYTTTPGGTPTPGGIPSTPMPLTVATGDLVLGYTDDVGDVQECDGFQITVTLLEDRSAVESMATTGASMCGNGYTIAEVPPGDEHYDDSGTGARATSISFASDTERVTEGETVSIELVKDGDAAVTYRIRRSGTANADSDYDAGTLPAEATLAANATREASYPFDTELVFPAGESTLTLDLMATKDILEESEETLVLRLEVIEASRGYALIGANEEITITIINLPISVIQFGSPGYSGREDTTVTVGVTKTGNSTATVEVTLTADPGSDLADITPPFPRTLTFAAGDTVQTFDMVIGENTLADPTMPETFTLGLDIDQTSATVGHELQLGTQRTATFTITDLPITSIEFASTDYSGAEGTNISLVVNKTGDSAVTFDVTVDYTSPNTASAADIDLPNFTGFTGLRIAATATRVSFNLPLATDKEMEGNETLTLNLTNPAPENTAEHLAIIGTQGDTTVTITNVLPPTTTPDPDAIPIGERWYEWTWGPVSGTATGFTNNQYYAIGEFRTMSGDAILNEDNTYFHQYEVYENANLLYTLNLKDSMAIAGSVTTAGGSVIRSTASNNPFDFAYDTSGTASNFGTSFDLTTTLPNRATVTGLYNLGGMNLSDEDATVLVFTSTITHPTIRQKTSQSDGGLGITAPPTTAGP